MQINKRFIIGSIFLFFAFTSMAFGVENAPATFPKALVPQPHYEFDAVVDGTEVIHDYIIRNKGTALLEVQKVKTDWGCTAVSYPRQLPPGGEGKITIKVKTEGSGGKKLKKKAIVFTNDKKNPKINLTIAGSVEKFVTITPRWVKLSGAAGQELKSDVKIIPEEKYPFKIINVSSKKGANIRVELKKIKELEKIKEEATRLKERGWFDWLWPHDPSEL